MHVFVVHPEKKLSQVTKVKADTKDLIVRLVPWGKITGKLLDAEGKPIKGATIKPNWDSGKARYLFSDLWKDKGFTTNEDGSFQMDIPFPNLPFRYYFSLKNKVLRTGDNREEITLQAGETKSVGEIRVKSPESDD